MATDFQAKQFTKLAEHFICRATESQIQLGRMSDYSTAISSFQETWPHLQRSWKWMIENCTTQPIAELCLRYVRVVAPLLLARDHVETVRVWCNTARHVASSASEAGPVLAYYEACVYMKYKQMDEAKPLLETARNYLVTHEDAENPGICDVLTCLGVVYTKLGLQAEAEQLFEQASLFLFRRNLALHPYSLQSLGEALQAEAFDRSFSASGTMARFVRPHLGTELWSDHAGLITPPDAEKTRYIRVLKGNQVE